MAEVFDTLKPFLIRRKDFDGPWGLVIKTRLNRGSHLLFIGAVDDADRDGM